MGSVMSWPLLVVLGCYCCGPCWTVQVDVDIVQPDSSGRLVHHLPLEDQMLPTVYLGLLLTVILLLLLWGVELWLTWENVTGVHLACAASLMVRSVRGEGSSSHKFCLW